MIRAGFASSAHALVRTEMPYGPVDLWAGDVPRPEPFRVDRDARTAPDRSPPAWLSRPVEADRPGAAPLRPSGHAPTPRPGVPAWMPGSVDARRRGILVHGLLAHLAAVPEAGRDRAASAFLDARAGAIDAAARREVAGAVRSILDHPATAALFGPGSRGEAPIAGTLSGPGGSRLVSGQVDRMVVDDREVVVADIKTGARPADGAIPETYLRQLALYRALLADAFPDKAVRAVLVWATGPDVVRLDDAALDGALARALAEPA